MDGRDREGADQSPLQPPPDYEPPKVERVLGPVELDREVLYAGGGGSAVDG